jgi:hypothetical protein
VFFFFFFQVPEYVNTTGSCSDSVKPHISFLNSGSGAFIACVLPEYYVSNLGSTESVTCGSSVDACTFQRAVEVIKNSSERTGILFLMTNVSSTSVVLGEGSYPIAHLELNSGTQNIKPRFSYDVGDGSGGPFFTVCLFDCLGIGYFVYEIGN